MELESCINSNSLNVTLLILPKVTGNIPNDLCENKKWNHIQGLQLADPDFFLPGNIDILLGAEYVPLLMTDGRRIGQPNTPVAENTIFGWVLSGRVQNQQQSVRSYHVQCQVESILQKFWETEEVPDVKHFTTEELQAEKHFVQTHRRELGGRFAVKLPFNQNIANLGPSRSTALRRLHQVERRLAGKPELREKYNKFMSEYEQLGHMKLVRESEEGEKLGKTYYLPHHCVVKTMNSVSKFRVVFDGSSKTSTNISLNDCLQVGPTIQSDLYTLLLRFRAYPVVIKADIGKMYRQFWVDTSHRDFQRIVWRPSTADLVREYHLTTITYGTSSAPFLATRCLQQLALENINQFPAACAKLQDDVYVDDLITGGSSAAEVISLQHQLREIVSSAGMELLKWSSNNREVMEQIPENLREQNITLDFDKDNGVKALGVHWRPSDDTFSFSVEDIHFKGKVTKRVLLSEIAKVFDPLGLLSPVVIRAKIMMQELWKCDVAWDDELPFNILQRWKKYQEELKQIKQLKIPRCIIPLSVVIIKQELHGFADACEKGMCGVTFLRSELSDGSYHTKMVTAKTKVCPIKQCSLPRLELCAAVLVSKLLITVKKSLKLDVELYAWSDNTTVLKWISGFPGRWQTFIGNRVSIIQQAVPAEHWRHVAGEQNPADCGSRGISVDELNNHPLWWGPPWLSERELPIFTQIEVHGENLEERKSAVTHHAKLTCDLFINMIHSHSALPKLKRVCAYVLRFIQNCRKKPSDRNNSVLNPAELESALLVLIRTVQEHNFCSEIKSLSDNIEVSNKSKLKNLTPFLDAHNTLRVGGRLQKSELTDNHKHQIILPNSSHFTKLIIEYYHKLLCHGGFQLLWTTLQHKFWIVRARDTIRHIIRKCVVCRRHRADTAQQLMGNLPEARVTLHRPFENVGVDFAGPFHLRVMQGRSNKLMKGYMAVFICMSTKAVHLEPVSDLSTSAFLASLECFVSRRGMCKNSDNGTNFVGADKELRELFKSQQQRDLIQHELSNRSINWNFNAPSAQHQGGIWESAVKSAKFHLKRVVGRESLTFEQFKTVLCKVEAMLNSRPLTPMSPDPNDYDVLTPGHFLIGQPLAALPQPDYTETKMNRLSKWQRAQQITQHFWRRWSNEYLTTLQKRFKWTTKGRNLAVGDIVIVHSDLCSPMYWKMGRVIATHPGNDGLVRVVTVRVSNDKQTKSCELKRPVVKLCPLLYNDEYD